MTDLVNAHTFPLRAAKCARARPRSKGRPSSFSLLVKSSAFPLIPTYPRQMRSPPPVCPPLLLHPLELHPHAINTIGDRAAVADQTPQVVGLAATLFGQVDRHLAADRDRLAKEQAHPAAGEI